ncbi:hypothetical protein, partial [Pseudomonas viridiflava]|uniref:hypothetical protein n=1 Tax=Pseudomonas viridiflava TaxID=33069 RepID=UPI0013CEEDA8
HAIKLSNERRTKKLNPAMALLNKYHGAPSKVARLFNASLGGSMNQELYRGARVPSSLNLAPGMLLTTSGFTAFTPDEKTAESFMGRGFMKPTMWHRLSRFFSFFREEQEQSPL